MVCICAKIKCAKVICAKVIWASELYINMKIVVPLYELALLSMTKTNVLNEVN